MRGSEKAASFYPRCTASSPPSNSSSAPSTSSLSSSSSSPSSPSPFQHPRGTDRVVWKHLTYDDLKKLGLRPETEARLRQHPDPNHPQRSGLLVVNQLVPGGPAEGKLDVGDILLQVDGADCTTFVARGAPDAAVGKR